jgi:hypothetical protein
MAWAALRCRAVLASDWQMRSANRQFQIHSTIFHDDDLSERRTAISPATGPLVPRFDIRKIVLDNSFSDRQCIVSETGMSQVALRRMNKHRSRSAPG